MGMGKRSDLFTGCSLSRRDILRAGSVVIPAGLLLPAWLDAGAQTALGFDFYISPLGSDSNPGTQAQPWAITAINTKRPLYFGKRVGLMDGTYDLTNVNGVNLLAVAGGSYYAAALEVDGGTTASPTVIQAINPRKAVLSAKTSNGQYGGYTGSGHSQASLLRHGSSMPHQGYLVLDGLKFVGALTGCVQIGTYAQSNNLTGVIIRNCEFTDQRGVQPDGYIDNNYMLELNNGNGIVVDNNYFHDGFGWTMSSDDHYSSILCWQSVGTVIEYNTCINASNIYGKEILNQGTIIRYNYIQTRSGFSTGGIGDWTGANASGLTRATSIYNNILNVGGGGATLLATLGGSGAGWSTGLSFYNNTVVLNYAGICQQHFGAWTEAVADGQLSFYNNVFAGNVSPDRKMIGVNAKAWAKCAYNCYPSNATFRILAESNASPDSSAGDFGSLPLYLAGVIKAGGIPSMETGSMAVSQLLSALFQLTGTNADQFRLKPGSAAIGSGRSDGTPSGAPVDMGAWGNGATQIGCNFSSGVATPNAPVLSIS
jgi:hypothetical protein